MKRGDLICDVDYIYGAISNNDPHDAELYIHEIACKIASELKDIIRNRKGNWKDAYVVSVANTKEQLMAEKERVNADECIFIDTPYEVCMDRARERPLYFQWIIKDWFETRSL